MLYRSEVLRTAWAKYRQTAALIGLTKFSRMHFAAELRAAWECAKLDAYFAALAIEEAAEAVANPAKADARAELYSLQMKDRWTRADHDHALSLHRAMAA